MELHRRSAERAGLLQSLRLPSSSDSKGKTKPWKQKKIPNEDFEMAIGSIEASVCQVERRAPIILVQKMLLLLYLLWYILAGMVD